MIISRLQDHKSAQCHIEYNTEAVRFISYRTMVIEALHIEGNTWRIGCTGTYSRTTIRQIGWFLKEYFPSLNYYDMKSIAGTNTMLTIERW